MRRDARDETVKKVLDYCSQDLKLNDEEARLILGRARFVIGQDLHKERASEAKKTEQSPAEEETTEDRAKILEEKHQESA
jgi:hypothetical protein